MTTPPNHSESIRLQDKATAGSAGGQSLPSIVRGLDAFD